MEEQSIQQFEQWVKDGKFDEKCRLEKDDLVLMIRVYDEPCQLEDDKEFKGTYLIELLIRNLQDSDKLYYSSLDIVSYNDAIKIIKLIMG